MRLHNHSHIKTDQVKPTQTGSTRVGSPYISWIINFKLSIRKELLERINK